MTDAGRTAARDAHTLACIEACEARLHEQYRPVHHALVEIERLTRARYDGEDPVRRAIHDLARAALDGAGTISQEEK